MSPSSNAMPGTSAGNVLDQIGTLVGSDGFVDLNPSTKTLDAYVSFCLIPQTVIACSGWRQNAQHQMHRRNRASQNHEKPSGLASNIRPHFLSTSPKPNPPPSSGGGSILSALLSRRQNIPYSNSPSTSSSSAYYTAYLSLTLDRYRAPSSSIRSI